jgi:hypothetical protein
MFIFSNRRSVFRTLIPYFSNIHRAIHRILRLFRQNSDGLHSAYCYARQPNNHNGNKKHRKRSDENKRRRVSHHKGGKADAESLFFKEAGYGVVVGEKVERAVENC